jgi:hypothetical protein
MTYFVFFRDLCSRASNRVRLRDRGVGVAGLLNLEDRRDRGIAEISRRWWMVVVVERNATRDLGGVIT